MARQAGWWRDWTRGPLLWEPLQPSPAGPAAPGTACFCQAPPSRSIVLPSPFSVSFVNVPNAAEASATQ